MAQDITSHAWALEHGFPPPTVNRWGKETDPDMDMLERVATALKLPLLDVLLIAEYISSDDVGGRNVPVPEKPSVLRAIQVDDSLSDDNKQALIQIYGQLRNGGKVIDTRPKGRKPSSRP